MQVWQLPHYAGLELLGEGGMGVVYRAEDTRLKRQVALKFLPPELTRDEEARQRFMHEAETASALDHPNICTIYEIDSTPDGRLFIAMPCYEGETLKERLKRGPLAVDAALDVGIQMAQGLAKAHHAKIVHRDIKPANLFVTTDGVVKILDFGIAKLVGETGLTRTGQTPGTVAYMSPEQVTGDPVDEQSDVWAVGAVLYEMLTAKRAFDGDHVSVIHAIINRNPTPLGAVRPDVPAPLQRIVTRALAKRRNERYRSIAQLLNDLIAFRGELARRDSTMRELLRARLRRPAVIAAVVLIGSVGAGFAGWSWNHYARIRRAREQGLPELARLVQADSYPAALALLRQIEAVIPGDATVAEIAPRISVRRRIDTDPPGADVYIKPYDAVAGVWEHLGRTPLPDQRLPYGVFRWKFERDGYDAQEFILGHQLIPGAGQTFPLVARGRAPTDMIAIPSGDLSLSLIGYNEYARVPSATFWFGRHEVTNSQFKAFVDAGAYSKREYWKHDFIKDGRRLSSEDAMTQFRDRTGRPGPATWDVGTYPQGQDDYPVGGVSWYEAAAFAEFSGQRLPTVYHWLRAAGTGLGGYITPLSNVQGKGPASAGSHPGVTPVGAFDMAGNVKEWCWNEVAGERNRYILGGSWSEPDYMFIHADARHPFDRSETNGFRLMKYGDGVPAPAALARPLEAPTRDYTKEKPVSEEVFRAFKDLYVYDQIPLAARRESMEETEHWIKEKVSFRAAYGTERVPAFLFLPKNVKPPYQTLVYAPNASALRTPSSNTLQNVGIIDFLMMSGRAVLYPIYKGTYERNVEKRSVWPEMNQGYRNWMLQVVADARRSVDYLESRPDIRRDQIAFFGQSWGAQIGSVILAVEPRLKAAVFLSGGYPMAPAPPAVDPFHFAPRVSVPVLMLNGDIDYITPVATSQLPLYTQLGTTNKRHRIFPGGHFAFWTNSRSQIMKESLDWLDTHVAPVN